MTAIDERGTEQATAGELAAPQAGRWREAWRRTLAWVNEAPRDAETEAAFEEHAVVVSRYWSRVVMAAVAASCILFWPTDFLFHQDRPEYVGRFAVIRAAVVTVTLSSLLIFDRSEFWRRRPDLLESLGLIGCCFVTGYNLGALAGLDQPWFYVSYPVLCMTAVMMVPLAARLTTNVLTAAAWSIGYIGLHPANHHTPFVASTLVFQGFVVVFATLIGHGIYHLARRTFFQERRLAALANTLTLQAEALAREQAISERLLLNVLPPVVADQLKGGQQPIAERFDEVTVLFADLAGFTTLSQSMSPDALVQMLNHIFSEFDALSDRYGVEKIKTVGDAYMAAAGLPTARPDHAEAVVTMALEMLERLDAFTLPDGGRLMIRIGIATGPVVAGVIGTRKFIYDLWGDTVNTASRMESHGVSGRIQVSERTFRALQGRFEFEHRGSITVKGLGAMETWFVLGKRPAAGAAEPAEPEGGTPR